MSTKNEIKGVVVLAFGPQPLDFISKAAKACGKQAVLDRDVARMAGAMMAVGDPEVLDALRQRLNPGAFQAERDAHPTLSIEATNWLASGERGISSNTIFTHLTGVDALRDWGMDHPHDPADFRRCRLLVAQVPELRPLLPRMADVSPVWAALVNRWDEICACMDTAPADAYDLMRTIINEAKVEA